MKNTSLRIRREKIEKVVFNDKVETRVLSTVNHNVHLCGPVQMEGLT